PSESWDEVVEHLVERGVAGQVIALQLHGEREPDRAAALARAGAAVIEVPVYRWLPPTDPAPLHRLIDLVGARYVDAVTFTSAPAAEALLRAAGSDRDRLIDALRRDV